MKMPKLSLDNTRHKSRPYWHVDMKWLVSLFLLVTVAVLLLVLVVRHATSPQVGVELTTNILAASFSREGVDDPKDIEEIRAQIAASPTKSIQPIPGFPVTITEKDLELSPRDIREKIFRQIAEPIYEKGVDQYSKELSDDPAQQKAFANSASLLGFITKERYEQLSMLAWQIGVIALVLLALAVYFSHRFGRLVTPGVVLMLASLPGTLIFLALQKQISESRAPETVNEGFDIGHVIFQAKAAIMPLINYGVEVYRTVLLYALGLLLLALVGRIVFAIVKHRRKTSSA